MSADEIDRIVAELQKRWPYIDIDKDRHYDQDWRELVQDVLQIAEVGQCVSRQAHPPPAAP